MIVFKLVICWQIVSLHACLRLQNCVDHSTLELEESLPETLAKLLKMTCTLDWSETFQAFYCNMSLSRLPVSGM